MPAATAHVYCSAGVHAQPLDALMNYGLYDRIGESNMFGNVDDALDAGAPRRSTCRPAAAPRGFTGRGSAPRGGRRSA